MILKNFIVFEGIDGAGTTTQINLLRKKYTEGRSDVNFFFSSEPTSRETGVFLRRVLKGEIRTKPQTAVYLFAADRHEHIFGEHGVFSHTNAGAIEVSDRYFFSSLAYQGVSIGPSLPEKVNEDFPLPELLFFFNISAEEAMTRIEARGEEKEIFEKREALEKISAEYKKVINRYEADSSRTGMRVVRIDASARIEEIAAIIEREIEAIISRARKSAV